MHISDVIFLPFVQRGVEPWDKPDVIYVEREEPGAEHTTILKSEHYFRYDYDEVVFEMAQDFEVQENYMFATRKVIHVSTVALTAMV